MAVAAEGQRLRVEQRALAGHRGVGDAAPRAHRKARGLPDARDARNVRVAALVVHGGSGAPHEQGVARTELEQAARLPESAEAVCVGGHVERVAHVRLSARHHPVPDAVFALAVERVAPHAQDAARLAEETFIRAVAETNPVDVRMSATDQHLGPLVDDEAVPVHARRRARHRRQAAAPVICVAGHVHVAIQEHAAGAFPAVCRPRRRACPRFARERAVQMQHVVVADLDRHFAAGDGTCMVQQVDRSGNVVDARGRAGEGIEILPGKELERRGDNPAHAPEKIVARIRRDERRVRRAFHIALECDAPLVRLDRAA